MSSTKPDALCNAQESVRTCFGQRFATEVTSSTQHTFCTGLPFSIPASTSERMRDAAHTEAPSTIFTEHSAAAFDTAFDLSATHSISAGRAYAFKITVSVAIGLDSASLLN